jgi:hypothetical protein
MRNKDEILLEKAYLSISNPVPDVPSEEEVPQLDDVGGEVFDEIEDGNELTSMEPTTPMQSGSCGCEFGARGCKCGNCPDCGQGSSDAWSSEESEEDEMTITNLDSIRDSITKVASFCSGGGHLESWQQQKLAIAMDNLAEVARRIRH